MKPYKINKIVTILINTKDRKEELAKAIESCLLLTGEPAIFVFDDGSKDGTYEFVKEQYKRVEIFHEENSIGLINARTKAASLINTKYIFVIDDDAIFSDKNIVLDILKFFNHPSIAVVSIPYIDILFSNTIRQKGIGNEKDFFYLPEYRGTAHALRRDIFISLGGYRGEFIRQGEEKDYAMRLYKAGYNIRLGNSAPILHYESTQRNKRKIAFYAARNTLIIVLLYTPFLLMPLYLSRNLYLLIIDSIKNKNIIQNLKGIYSGIKVYYIAHYIPCRFNIKEFIAYKKLRYNRS